jgi:hypothetical protein
MKLVVSNNVFNKGNIHMQLRKNTLMIAAVAAGLLSLQTEAVEGRVSGFGTIGASSTDSPTGYDRGLDKSSSPAWVNDTKAGIQADVNLSPKMSMTAQVVAKQSSTDDGRLAVQGEWLFGAYKVDDSTKVRAGKLRLPLFMMSEQLDVGKAYTLAKLPLEMYGQAPTNGYVGVDALKTFEVGEDGSLTVQPYVGSSRFDGRGINPMDGTTMFKTFEADNIRGLNVVFDYNDMLRLRAGYMATSLSYKDEKGSMVGGMMASMVDKVDASFTSLGAQVKLGSTTISGEYGQRRVNSAAFADTNGRYLTVEHKLGAFTPYATYSAISSNETKTVNGMQAPVLEQETKSVGVAYAIDGNSSVKAETSQVSVGSNNTSNEFFNDAAAVKGNTYGVYRLNYNLMF